MFRKTVTSHMIAIVFLFTLFANEVPAQTYDTIHTSRQTDTSLFGDSKTYSNSILFQVVAQSGSGDSGGAYFARNYNVTFSNRVSFIDNRAGAYGGAAALNDVISATSITFNSDTLFDGNSAVNWGGGVYIGANPAAVASNSTVNFNGNLTASGNSAAQGGFLFSYAGDANFNGTSVFTGNTAAQGGVLYIRGGLTASPSTKFSGNSTFSNNSASSLGGAVYLESPSAGRTNVLEFSGSGTTLFQGNTDSAGANDVYMELNSRLHTTGSGEYLFYGGIASNANRENVDIVHSGSGKFLADLSRYHSVYQQTGGSSVIMGDTDAKFTFNAGTVSEFQGSLLNPGTIVNAGSLTLSGTGKTITGTLTGTSGANTSGNLIVTGSITNNTVIRQNTINIAETGSLTGNLANLDIGSKIINNSGTLALTDSTASNTYTINTSGLLNITGTINNTAVINNTGIINASGSFANTTAASILSTDAGNLILASNLFLNNGTLIFTGGTNDNEITGAGSLLITGGTFASPVINNAEISQTSLSVENTGSLQTAISSLTLADEIVLNNGNLILSDSGEDIKYDITNSTVDGEGNLYIAGTLANELEKTITQDTLAVLLDGSLSTNADRLAIANGITNYGDLVYTAGTNSLGVTNEGTLTLTAGVINDSGITGNGDTVISGTGAVINSAGKQINQRGITIEEDAELISNAGDITTSPLSAITNNGLLTFNDVSGTNTNNIAGNGVLNIAGEVTNTGEISQSIVSIIADGYLITDASNITADIINAGTVDFISASNANSIINTGVLNFAGAYENSGEISGSGDMFVKNGTVLNTGNIEQGALTVDAGAEFISDLGNLAISNPIINDGTLRLSGDNETLSIAIGQTSSDLGSLYITGAGTKIINDPLIEQHTLIVEDGAYFVSNASALAISGNITNHGTLELGGGANANAIINAGQLNLINDLINDAAITNQAGSYALYDSGINNGLISNTGTLRLGNVTNNGSIEGVTGLLEVFGSVINSVNAANAITQDRINIENSGSLTTDAGAVKAVTLLSNGGSLIFGSGDNSNIISNDGSVYFNQASAYNNGDINGNGTLVINGENIINNAYINQNALQVNSGSYFQSEGAKLYIGNGGVDISGMLHIVHGIVQTSGDVNINSGGILSFYNQTPDTSSVWVSGNAKTLTAAGGSLIYMDVFSSGNADKIELSEDAVLDGTLHVRIGVGTYEDETFDLIAASGSMSGDLVDDILNSTTPHYTLAQAETRGVWEVLYTSYKFDVNNNILSLTLNGVSRSDLSSLSGKTFNQSQAAKTIDKLSSTASGDLADLINGLIGYHMADKDMKKALSEISPYFLANVLRPRMDIADRTALYSRIKRYGPEKANNGLWAESVFGSEKFNANENSIGDFTYMQAGVRLGFDRYLASEDLMVGVYGSYSPKLMEQGRSSAFVNSFGGGLYAGLIREEWEVKALINAAADSYSTERKIYDSSAALNRKAKAEFDGYTVRGDVEAAYKMNVLKNVNFAPFAGLEATAFGYSGFKEKGAGSVNLKVEGDRNMSSSARIGLGFNGTVKKFVWTARAEYGYVIGGYKSEIESVFAGTDARFISKGAGTDRNILGASAGTNYAINEKWDVYINGDFRTAQNYRNINGTAGVRYTF